MKATVERKVTDMDAPEQLKPAKPKNRSWWISTNHIVHCYANPAADCVVTSLWGTAEQAATSFHDAELVRATGDINAILTRVEEKKAQGRSLSFIVVGNRPFLVWTTPSATGPDEPGAIGPHDEFQTLIKALGLKADLAAKPHKRSWILGPITHKIYCFASPAGDCLVHGLWESAGGAATSFHDAELVRATGDINSILTGINAKAGRGKDLSLIVVEDRPFLVWTEPGAVGSHDDPDAIEKALGLKGQR
ncbi:hypothetical protein [Paenarthrobacter sp. PH39-S1]|uniref:hypothetical protein n=1 Tax=Paenarthrobacter sp. PH39-S1 TaxID=3046204 RepID=UPI0024BB5F98|nr:hypothetical protein [Paenarthrobacter sp. PH39-S1]MDJ0358345.1 hypothetical protein [Paenarthrobacter sp. PH39-S1]